MLRKALKSRCQITNGIHQSHLLATTCASPGATILNPDRFAAGAVVDALGKHYEGVFFPTMGKHVVWSLLYRSIKKRSHCIV